MASIQVVNFTVTADGHNNTIVIDVSSINRNLVLYSVEPCEKSIE